MTADVQTATPPQVAPTAEAPDCDWVAFVRANGRVPMISDARRPWEYPGWLLHYRLLCEDHPSVAKRWDYWYRTMGAGRLLDEPIPRLESGSCGRDTPGFKAVDRWMHLVDGRRHSGSPLNDLVEWLLWGFGDRTAQTDLEPALQEALYRTVNLEPLLVAPADYFGEWLALHKGRWNPNAFYPTPHSVVEAMVRMALGEGDHRAKTVNDPALGTGRMLLHASNHALRLYGQDIDAAVLRICVLNGFLYAPWLVRPFPDAFFPAPPA